MKKHVVFMVILAMALVFGMTFVGCSDSSSGGGGGGGSISGTWGDGSSHEHTITFTGSNYTFADEDGTVLSSGTYTIDDKDITFNQTVPTSATYEGYYFPRDNPPCISVDFLGFNVDYLKK
ncbi:MAG: hypothetical protein FWG99_04460 [Treponema sp.]|nr:hypothetical protein [Treponema sp.]